MPPSGAFDLLRSAIFAGDSPAENVRFMLDALSSRTKRETG
jgi:hypothetical protein